MRMFTCCLLSILITTAGTATAQLAQIIPADPTASDSVTLQGLPTIESIEPRSGPLAGGTVVTIRGENLVSPFICTCPPIPAVVYIGGKLARVIENDDFDGNMIQIETPPSSGGRYDLTIGQGGIKATVSSAFQYGSNAFEKVLIPLMADRVPGGYGSIWSTELVARNDWSFAVPIRYPGADASTTVAGNSTFRPQLEGRDTAFLYAGLLDLSLRVRDLSRQADSWGTEIPIVREHDTGEKLHLLNVPIEPESRVTLRIYDFDGPTGGSVDVVVLNQDSDQILGQRTFALPAGEYQDFPASPGYLMIDPKALISETSGVSRVRIKITETPGGGDHRFWAFAAVTDLETQQVTIVSPQ